MLKKRKRKVKRRNTEPSVSRSGSPVKSASTPPVPMSAPPDRVGGAAGGGGETGGTPTLNLADLCDSPSHATPV